MVSLKQLAENIRTYTALRKTGSFCTLFFVFKGEREKKEKMILIRFIPYKL